MANWRTSQIPLEGGLDTKTDPKAASPASFVELENCVFTKRGSLRKRHGYDETPDFDSSDAQMYGEALASYKRGLIQLGKENIYSFDTASERFVEQGYFNHVQVAAKEVERTTETQYQGAQAEASGITVRAWEVDSAGITITVSDSATGALIHTINPSTNLSLGSKPLVVKVGDFVHVLFAKTSTTDLCTIPINPWNPTAAADSDTTVIASDMHASAIYDACPSESGAFAVFAWYSTGANTVRYGRLMQSGTTEYKQDCSTTVAPNIVVVGTDDQVAIIVYDDSTYFAGAGAIYCQGVYDIGGTPTSGGSPDFVSTGVPVKAGIWLKDGIAVIPVMVSWADPANAIVRCYTRLIDEFGGVSGYGLVSIRHADIAAHPFEMGGVHYLWVRSETHKQLQNCYILYAIDDVYPRVVGQIAVGEAIPVDTNHHLPRFFVGEDGKARGILSTRRQVDALNEDVFEHDGLLEVTVDGDAQVYSAQEAGDALYVAGGICWYYDGKEPVEAGFLQYPELDIAFGSTNPADHAAVNVATAGSLAAGTYGYKVYYEWTSATGERIRSAAVPFSVAAPGSFKVKLTIPTLYHTLKSGYYAQDTRTDVSIVVYRTKDGGSIYYRCSDPDPTSTGDNAYLANDRSADTVEFTDDMDDDTLGLNERDPATGGVLNYTAFPAHTLLLEAKRRLFVAGGGVPSNLVGFTLLRGDGEPAHFNGRQYVELPNRGGDVTGLASLNDNLVVFKTRQIYLVAGDGPNNLGQGDFQEPVQLATDSGCIDARSLVETPQGWMYQSEKGIYRLNRDFSIEYVGAEVEAFNGQTITSAELVPDQNLVVFLSSDGTTLAFDYARGKWSTFTSHQGKSAAIYDGKYCYLRNDGKVMRQNTAKWTDGNQVYRARAKTGPIRMGGLQEMWKLKRLYILGEFFSDHSLRLDLWFNREGAPRESVTFDPSDFVDDSTWGDDATWGDSEVWGGSIDSRDYQVSYAPETMKVQSVSLEFTELPGADPGRSFELTELAMLWAPMGGLARLADARRK